MKKLLIALSIILIAGVALAGQCARSSGEQTADGIISSKPCGIAGVTIITNSSSDAKLILYDNAAAASGTVLFERTVTGSNNGRRFTWPYPAECYNGIYADVTGTGASYIVEYIKE